MNLGSLPLHNILLGAAHVLGNRYPTDKKMEDNIRKVQEIWDTVRVKNPDFQEDHPCLRRTKGVQGRNLYRRGIGLIDSYLAQSSQTRGPAMDGGKFQEGPR